MALALRLRVFPRVPVAHRAFGTSTPRLASKESAPADASRAAEIETKKQEALREQKEGKGTWKDALASDSESIIKADRNEAGTTEEEIRRLQEEAKKVGGQ